MRAEKKPSPAAEAARLADEEGIARLIAEAPLLTFEQADRLAHLLTYPAPATTAAA